MRRGRDQQTGTRTRGRRLLALATLALLALAAPAEARAAAKGEGPRCQPRTVAVDSGATASISLRCKGKLNKVPVRIKKWPKHGLLGRVRQGRDNVDYRPDDGFAGADRLVAVRKQGGRKYRTVVTIEVGSPDLLGAAPSCGQVKERTNYETEVEIQITCTGEGLSGLEIESGPFSGQLGFVVISQAGDSWTLKTSYTPDDLFVGSDAIVFEASGAGGTSFGAAVITVDPWKLRALGDSVTAGFGYYADGSLMGASDLLDCKPATALSNRCSSNSPDGPGYTGPPRWTADYGLGNDVSWAAQFANGIQGGGKVTAPQMFQNVAVTGSAPGDWLPGGQLADEFKALIAENPDLVVMTLGANPLLSDLLLTEKGEECSFETTVAELEACLQPFFDEVQLVSRLQQVYIGLLQAPDAEIVTFQYHLSIPAANLFDVWQLETMIDLFNEQISTAVANTKAALPAASAARLHLIEAQVNPQSPSATLVPRFNIGLPPDTHQTWTAGYDCGVIFTDLVDGPSHQSDPTQDELLAEHPDAFCSSTDEWIIGADTGIHPTALGYTQFADTLANVAAAENLVPPLP